jgi:site-specific recombinase XerD
MIAPAKATVFAHTDDQLAWTEYELNMRVANRSERTMQSYQEALVQLAAFLGGPFTSATKADVSRFLVHIREEHSAGTQLVRHRSLRAAFGWLAAEEIVTRNPMLGVPAPKCQAKAPHVLTDDELDLIRTSCKPLTRGGSAKFADIRDAAMIEVLLSPGTPRLAELAALTLDDIDLSPSRPVVLIRHGKGDKRRLIPVTRRAAAALLKYLRARAAHKHADATRALWLGERDGFAVRGISQMLEARGRSVGLAGIHPHQFRHTTWHQWRAAGGDIDAGMIIWGWSRIEMALAYGRSASEERALDLARQIAS